MRHTLGHLTWGTRNTAQGRLPLAATIPGFASSTVVMNLGPNASDSDAGSCSLDSELLFPSADTRRPPVPALNPSSGPKRRTMRLPGMTLPSASMSLSLNPGRAASLYGNPVTVSPPVGPEAEPGCDAVLPCVRSGCDPFASWPSAARVWFSRSTTIRMSASCDGSAPGAGMVSNASCTARSPPPCFPPSCNTPFPSVPRASWEVGALLAGDGAPLGVGGVPLGTGGVPLGIGGVQLGDGGIPQWVASTR